MVKTSCLSAGSIAMLLLVMITMSVGRVAGTIYTVGGTSGWDISSDINSWAQDKSFVVGDSLWFQFSSYESVAELTRNDFNKCNTSNPLMINKSGNVTIPLTSPGDRFFASGNSMYCLSGLKLQVHIELNQNATVAAPAPGPTLSSLPPGSSKNNNPLSTSSGARLYLFNGRHVTLLWVIVGLFWFGCTN